MKWDAFRASFSMHHHLPTFFLVKFLQKYFAPPSLTDSKEFARKLKLSKIKNAILNVHLVLSNLFGKNHYTQYDVEA